MDDRSVRRARAGAQWLHHGRTTVDNIVRHMLAMQAQDIAATPLALRARSRGLTVADAAAAREERSIVRAWGPRGTLHLVCADDLPWLTAVLGPLGRTQALRRLTQEGVSGSESDLVRATERALAGQGPLTKAEFGQRLSASGLVAAGQGLVHLAFLGASHGIVVLGPDRGTKPTYVHAGDWLGTPIERGLDRAAGLAELARRYLRARGPAAPEDLSTWSGLARRDATAAFAAIGGELNEVSHRGRPLWLLRRGMSRPSTGEVVLLPAFDEISAGLARPPADPRPDIPEGGPAGRRHP